MEWIKLSDKKPKKNEEVIIASEEGIIKTVAYRGNDQFTTYLKVAYWMELPELPKDVCNCMNEIIQGTKKRGRPKKV